MHQFVKYKQIYTMEYFSVIKSMCRIGLGTESAAFRKQVERLRDSLKRDGKKLESEAITQLLETAQRGNELRPSKVMQSRINWMGEQLTETTSPPVDRETGAPLAELRFSHDQAAPFPVLSPELTEATHAVVAEWENIDSLRKLGVYPPRSCLLYGLPGTGKTQLALAIANRLRLPLVVARLDGLISSFLGTTARNISNLFQFCNRYQCILLLDEFDAVAKVRDDPHEVGEIKRVVNTLLQNLDVRAELGFTIAVTNHENLLDSAIWRRFEVRIHVPVPNLQAREEILAKYLPPLVLTDAQIRLLAWLTDKLTGADIELLVRTIKRYLALNKNADFLRALATYAITHSGNENNKERQLMLNDHKKLACALNKEDPKFFHQSRLAELFHVAQTTIGRWLKPE